MSEKTINPFKIVFTDSGLGGISVMADFYNKLHYDSVYTGRHHFELVFFNALPENGKGYNTMASQEQKVSVFNNALNVLQRRHNPDLIALACNTLSAIYPHTAFAGSNRVPLLEIVSVGRGQIALQHEKYPADPICIMATPTTIASAAYHTVGTNTLLISGERLASEIELDDKSPAIADIVARVFDKIEENLNGKRDITLFLGCTHYGYIQEEMLRISSKYDFNITRIINPNLSFTQQLLQMARLPQAEQEKWADQPPKIDLRVESQAKIDPRELSNISRLIEVNAPRVADALQNYTRLTIEF